VLFESDEIPSEDLVFFDLETTGLSGGAGTIAFLIGFATVEGNSVVLQQRFLSDYPGEKDFLRELDEIFTPDKIYVSYNGKGFDTHILKTRFTMNGLTISMNNQIDLLYFSRRFWKRVLGSCALTDIERALLARERSNDIPGYLIPDVYFDFQRTKDTCEILRVFEHNETDIISLVELFGLVAELTTKGTDASRLVSRIDFPLDRTALGEYFLRRNNDQGLKLLCNEFPAGDMRAGRVLGSHYKRHREWQSATDVWKKMWDVSKNSHAALELAKYFEHIAKNYDTALVWANLIRTSDCLLNAFEADQLVKRILRIEHKIEVTKQRDHGNS
jgi:DNA polymerase III epsilon subunit-like protein